MNSMLEDFPCRNVQNFSKAKINSAPERASKSPETFPKYIHYEDNDNAQKIVKDHPNLYQKYMHKQMELQREKERPERKRAANNQNGQQTKVRKSQ
ncbi:unnamed protein product [Oikopleura dioica]|nr:unnamed protein product [Oikopleura dioica]